MGERGGRGDWKRGTLHRETCQRGTVDYFYFPHPVDGLGMCCDMTDFCQRFLKEECWGKVRGIRRIQNYRRYIMLHYLNSNYATLKQLQKGWRGTWHWDMRYTCKNFQIRLESRLGDMIKIRWSMVYISCRWSKEDVLIQLVKIKWKKWERETSIYIYILSSKLVDVFRTSYFWLGVLAYVKPYSHRRRKETVPPRHDVGDVNWVLVHFSGAVLQ